MQTTIANQQAELVWAKCLDFIREYLPEDAFKTWFLPIRPIQLEGQTLTIELPNHYFYEWIEEYYLLPLRKALHKYVGEQAKLEYAIIVDKENEFEGKLVLENQKSVSNKATRTISHPIEALRNQIEGSDEFDSQLNCHFTFDNFVESSCNEFALGVGKKIADYPGIRTFNPFLIFGKVGVGKTHLAHAIGNEIKRKNPKAKVFQVNCEQFISNFVEAVREENQLKNGAVKSFTDFYMQLDVLILDDIQFMSKKEKTQDNFFNIFNHLHLLNKQIILTSDCAPKNIEGFKERLLSRLKYGVHAEIHPPDFNFRQKWLNRACKTQGLPLSESMIDYIAKENFSCVRELEGVLMSILAQHSIMKRSLTLELIQEVIHNQISIQEREISIPAILSKVSKSFQVTIEDIQSKSKIRDVTEARQVAMYFAKNYTNLPVKTIAQELGKRDHSAVSHAVKAVAEKLKQNASFRAKLEEIASQFKVQLV
ncbi:MAG: chromosomal replication initiator protein DnaA [Cytophagales bacterium]|nr:chromosomal replication initiator protein DnaA [Cytophagales bacterium]MDW8385057.1 chromosomal replication initiator protein DnaA [Flammeovirgaceae bacterium]